MHNPRLLALGLAVAGLGALAPTALASPNQAINLDKAKAEWTGPVSSAINTSFFLDGIAGPGGTCGAVDDPQAACDKTLVHLTGIVGEGSTVKFRIDGFQQYSDFDLRVYTADEKGVEQTELDGPTSTDAEESSPLGADDPRRTANGDFENLVTDVFQYADPETGAIDQWFAVEVPYFVVANDSYAGHATLDAKPFVAPEPDEFEE